MTSSTCNFIWRCAKCSYHFVNVIRIEGELKQEKKCPKCKSLNKLTLSNKGIFVHCNIYNPETNGYCNELEENYSANEINNKF